MLDALGVIALAACEPKVVVELAPVRLEARSHQDEPVRLEELPEIDVGKRARVRGIARALEAVQRERLQRVGRRDLIVDEDAPSGSRDARKLGEGALWVRDVVQRPARAREVEGAGVERQIRRVPLDERRIRRCVRPRPLEQLRDDVHTDDLTDERRQCERERPGTGAHVEGTLIAVRQHEGLELLAHHLHLLLCVFGDKVSRRAETCAHVVDVRLLSHRSRYGVHAEDRIRSWSRARS